jgi:DNA-binding Lrp family transcriptional regulator
MTNSLTALECALINRFQGGVPLEERPYREMAHRLATDEPSVIVSLGALLERRILSRFGPSYDAARLGGALTLAALQVPENDFDRVAALVNAMPEVAHNYRREHELNMWFVLATETPEAIARSLARIEQATGLTVYDFPKGREFFLGLKLAVHEDGWTETVAQAPAPRPGADAETRLSEADRRIVAATEAGLPLTREPFAAIGAQTGLDSSEVIARVGRMIETGIIRRIGAIPNHYRLGLRANGMTVWDIADEHLPELGARIGALGFVSHCYERPRHLPLWPYNLFAMVHGRNRNEVRTQMASIARLIGKRRRAYDVLFSSAILKKTGFRLAA